MSIWPGICREGSRTEEGGVRQRVWEMESSIGVQGKAAVEGLGDKSPEAGNILQIVLQ